MLWKCRQKSHFFELLSVVAFIYEKKMHQLCVSVRFSSAAKMERVEDIINNKYVKLMAQ